MPQKTYISNYDNDHTTPTNQLVRQSMSRKIYKNSNDNLIIISRKGISGR